MKTVIFDFDGTLADTAPIMRSIYAEMATKHRLRVMSDADYATLRKGSLLEARRWSGIHFWQVPLMIRSVKKLMKLEAEKVHLFPGVPEMVRELDNDGVRMYILSRNAPETIERVLERYKLKKYLQILPRRKRSFGGKSEVISALVRRNQLHSASVWMIGDEVRDMQAATKAGVQSVAVSWGLQHEVILSKYEPTHVVETIEQLHNLLRSTANGQSKKTR